MKLPSDITIQYALYPIIIVLKLFGIMPLTLKSQNLKLITSKLDLIFSISFSLISFFVGTFVFVNVMKRASLSAPSIAELNNTEVELSFDVKQLVYINKLDCSTTYTAHIISFYVGNFVLRSQLPNFCSKINILDNFINVIMSNSINLKQRQISMFATVFVIISYLVSYLCNVILAVENNKLLFMLPSLILNCAVTQIFCCEVLFASCCYSLWTRLQVLNETLYEYFYYPLRNTPKNRIEYIKLFKNEEKKRNEKLLLLELIRKSHWRLCCLMDDLNSMFQLQLLVSLSFLFFQITTTMYIVLWQPLYVFQKGNTHSVKCIWCLIYIGRFILCVTSASTTVDELTMFYTDVMARSIGFSTYGLLEVKTSLIAKAVAAATTYLVILIQMA